jgi:hypothetical protein
MINRIKLERIPLHSSATSMVIPGNENTGPVRRTGTPNSLNTGVPARALLLRRRAQAVVQVQQVPLAAKRLGDFGRVEGQLQRRRLVGRNLRERVVNARAPTGLEAIAEERDRVHGLGLQGEVGEVRGTPVVVDEPLVYGLRRRLKHSCPGSRSAGPRGGSRPGSPAGAGCRPSCSIGSPSVDSAHTGCGAGRSSGRCR